MSFFNDEAFTFTNEDDLLPVWTSSDEQAVSESYFDNFWPSLDLSDSSYMFSMGNNYDPLSSFDENYRHSSPHPPIHHQSCVHPTYFPMHCHPPINHVQQHHLHQQQLPPQQQYQLPQHVWDQQMDSRSFSRDHFYSPKKEIAQATYAAAVQQQNQQKQYLPAAHTRNVTMIAPPQEQPCQEDALSSGEEADIDDLDQDPDQDFELDLEFDRDLDQRHPMCQLTNVEQEAEPMMCDVDDDVTHHPVDPSDPSVDFKLPASKTPIMEAMVVCAINNWGLSVVKSTPGEVIFKVSDFDRYYRISRAICSKHRPTEDVGSRVKSLRRWFVNFPKKKDRQENPQFLLVVKPNGSKKVCGLIERNSRLLLTKRRRRQ